MTMEYIEPEEIEVDRGQSQLKIKWNDRHEGHSDFLTLRWNCPCAGCRGEMGVPGRLDFIKTLAPDESKLERLEAVGLYALKPVWKDGHETGFYTYEHLRDLCQCDECMAARPTKFMNRKLVR